MKVRAHTAVYGDVNGAHDLIEPKANSPLPLKKITRFTDRPGHLPPHVSWRPYISGFPFEDYYILTRTFPDPTASRAGMVLTHALVFKLADAVQMSDLAPALLALPDQFQRRMDDSPIEIVVPDVTPHDTALLGLTSLIHELLEEDRSDRPVVWVGQDGFEEIISALWRGLWPGARRIFRFRISFMPQDVEGQELNVVVVPEGAENRWGGYPQARPSDEVEPQTKAEAFLLRRPDGEPLRTLLAELGAEPRAIPDLKKIEACHEYLERLRADKANIDAGGVRMMVRLLGVLSPKVDQGKALKSEMLDVLLELTTRGTAADVKALRNFDAQPFEAGDKKITEAVTVWVRQHILAPETTASKQNTDLIQASLASATSSWGRSVLDALKGVLSDWPKGAAQAVWQWWHTAPALIEGIGPLLPNSKRVEENLAKKCPSRLTEEEGEAVSQLAQRRSWFVLHAVGVGAFCEPVEALRRQLYVDEDEHRFEGLRALTSRVPAVSLLEFALENGEPRLLKLSGEACARDSSLMAHMDVECAEWRRIWLHALDAGAPTIAGISHAREVVDGLITLLISGTAIEGELLAHLADTPYADLTLHPQRREAWQHLDAQPRKLFLNATADGWLQHLKADPNFDPTVEGTLEGEILIPSRIARHINAAGVGGVSFLVNLFIRFTRLTSDQFRVLLSVTLNSRQPVDVFDAVLLGRFIRDRSWRGSAKQLAGYLDANRRDLAPAVRECQNLLGLFDSFRLKFAGKLDGVDITEEDWWGALNETATELYQFGPEQDQLWGRAGGDLSTVNRHQSGRAGWGEALNILRHGGGGADINPYKLIREMCRDFPNNSRLHLLQQWLERR